MFYKTSAIGMELGITTYGRLMGLHSFLKNGSVSEL
jgi:hypothetical protein